MNSLMPSGERPVQDYRDLEILYDLGLASIDQFFDELYNTPTEDVSHSPAMTEEDRAYNRVIRTALQEFHEPKMTAEEQRAYVPMIQSYVQIKKTYRNIEEVSPEELEVVKTGLQARDELVIRMLPLAKHFVRQSMGFYKNKPSTNTLKAKIIGDIQVFDSIPLDYSDRLQVATEVLIVAAEKYNGDHSFTSFVLWALEARFARLSSELAEGGFMRLPVHIIETLRKYDKKTDELTGRDGDFPSFHKVASELGVSTEKAENFERMKPLLQNISYEVIKAYFDDQQAELFIGAVDEDAECLSLDDLLVDEGSDSSIESEIVLDELGAAVDRAISPLSDRVQEMIECRFGFGLFEGGYMTYEEIGKRFNLTRERIRMILAATLSKLRQPIKGEELRQFLDGGNDDPQFGLRALIPFTEDDDAILGIERGKKIGPDNPAEQVYTYAERQKIDTLRMLECRRRNHSSMYYSLLEADSRYHY